MSCPCPAGRTAPGCELRVWQFGADDLGNDLRLLATVAARFGLEPSSFEQKPSRLNIFTIIAHEPSRKRIAPVHSSCCFMVVPASENKLEQGPKACFIVSYPRR